MSQPPWFQDLLIIFKKYIIIILILVVRSTLYWSQHYERVKEIESHDESVEEK